MSGRWQGGAETPKITSYSYLRQKTHWFRRDSWHRFPVHFNKVLFDPKLLKMARLRMRIHVVLESSWFTFALDQWRIRYAEKKWLQIRKVILSLPWSHLLKDFIRYFPLLKALPWSRTTVKWFVFLGDSSASSILSPFANYMYGYLVWCFDVLSCSIRIFELVCI